MALTSTPAPVCRSARADKSAVATADARPSACATSRCPNQSPRATPAESTSSGDRVVMVGSYGDDAQALRPGRSVLDLLDLAQRLHRFVDGQEDRRFE